MRNCLKIEIENTELFKNKFIFFAQTFSVSCILNSNNYNNGYNTFDFIAAIDSIDSLEFNRKENPFNSLLEFKNKHNDWLFGHFNYDLKNYTEELFSENPDYISFEEMFFFRPKYLLTNSI